MNLSTAIFLVNKSVRAVRVTYDPDQPRNNNPTAFYKTFDDTLTKGDYVIVPTGTRHGFTVARVDEIDLRVNFDSDVTYAWIVGKVDKAAYDHILEQEAKVCDRVAIAEENRKRKELSEALGLAAVDLTDLDVVKSNAQLSISSPRGAQPQTIEVKPT